LSFISLASLGSVEVTYDGFKGWIADRLVLEASITGGITVSF